MHVVRRHDVTLMPRHFTDAATPPRHMPLDTLSHDIRQTFAIDEDITVFTLTYTPMFLLLPLPPIRHDMMLRYATL